MLSKSVMVSLVLAACLGAQPILEIAGVEYAQTEIDDLRSSVGEDPAMVVKRLCREAAVHELGEEVALVDSAITEASVYRRVWQRDKAADEMLSHTYSVEEAEWRGAQNRLALFERLMEARAEVVPVRYLDAGAFWKLVQASEPYQIRKKAGHIIPFGALEYTIAELAVAEDAVVALQDGTPVLVGGQYNEFVREHYRGLQPLAKRDRPLAEVRKDIALHAVRGRLVLELLAKGEAVLSDSEVTALTRKVAQRVMFRSVVHVAGLETKGRIRQVMANLVERTRAHNAEVLVVLEQAARGMGSTEIADPRLRSVLLDAASLALLKEIENSLADSDVYAWMGTTSFPGSVREARMAMAHEQQLRRLDSIAAERQIQIVVN